MIIIHIACHNILIDHIEEKLSNKEIENLTIKTIPSLIDDFITASENKNIKINTFQKTFKERFQKYIHQFVEEQEEENNLKVVAFIGPNMYCYLQHQKYEYDGKECVFPKGTFSFEADHKFHIKDDPDHIIHLVYDKEYDDHVDKMCDWFKDEDRKTKLYKELRYNQQENIQMINHRFIDFFRFDQIKKHLIKCVKHYRKIGYRIFPVNNIIKEVRVISNKIKQIIKEKEKEKEKRL